MGRKDASKDLRFIHTIGKQQASKLSLSNHYHLFELMNVNRGEHKLKLELLDPLGKVIASSPVTTIYLHRTTQASGGR